MKNRILIVDDAYINRELLKEMLSENYEILEAENGKEALDIVENEKHINGILLDLVMPVMDGFELLEELKKTDIMDKIPVMIICSPLSRFLNSTIVPSISMISLFLFLSFSFALRSTSVCALTLSSR